MPLNTSISFGFGVGNGLARVIKWDDFFLPFQTNSEFGFKHEINFSTTHFFLQYYLQCVVTPVNIVLHLSSNIES